MSCPVCQQTMQQVKVGLPPVWWCPNCGTLKSEGQMPECETPWLAKMMPEAIRKPHTLRETDREIDALALLVEHFHEIRKGGQPQSVIVYMPEIEVEPYVVVRFGGLAGGSAVQHFADAREAAKCYLGVE